MVKQMCAYFGIAVVAHSVVAAQTAAPKPHIMMIIADDFGECDRCRYSHNLARRVQGDVDVAPRSMQPLLTKLLHF